MLCMWCRGGAGEPTLLAAAPRKTCVATSPVHTKQQNKAACAAGAQLSKIKHRKVLLLYLPARTRNGLHAFLCLAVEWWQRRCVCQEIHRLCGMISSALQFTHGLLAKRCRSGRRSCPCTHACVFVLLTFSWALCDVPPLYIRARKGCVVVGWCQQLATSTRTRGHASDMQ